MCGKILDEQKICINAKLASTCLTLALLLFSVEAQAMCSNTELSEERVTVSKAAKIAAYKAAKKTARNLIQDKTEAKDFAKSLLKGKLLELKNSDKDTIIMEKDKERYKRCKKLAQKSIAKQVIDEATQAAYKAAYVKLQDEKEAQKVVDSLKLNKYAKKANKKGKGEFINNEPSDQESNIKTIKEVNEFDATAEKDIKENIHMQHELLKQQMKEKGLDYSNSKKKTIKQKGKKIGKDVTKEAAKVATREAIKAAPSVIKSFFSLIPH